MAELPPLKYGKVVGRFLANTADGADIGDTPEFPPLQGTLTFTAGAPKVLVAAADPAPATYVQLPQYYKVSLDEFGYITWRGQRGVKLVAPNGDTNPSSWTWTVSFDLTYDGQPVTLPAFSFEVPEYIPGPDPENPDVGSTGLVDLTLASPVPASPGNAVVRGLSVVSVTIDGSQMTFGLDNGTSLPPVTIPAVQDALDAAAAAASSETAAASSAAAAQAAADSFDLTVGDVTTGPPGGPAQVTVTGPGPSYELDFVLPQGPEGPQGPPAPDADATTKGILRLAGDLGGTATAPTVPGLAGKSNVGHTHPATDINNSTSVGRSVLTAADAAAARSAIGAGTSSLTLGTTAGTAAAGDDPRLSDARTPAVGTVPYDVHYIAAGKSTTRAVGTGDMPFGLKMQRAVTFSKVTYRCNTASASGDLVVELRKNGVTVAGSSATIPAASQVAGGTATGTFTFAEGDVLTVFVTAVGTTPGTGLIAELKGLA
ncbi:hypothetical protein IU414_06685 [Nocardia farcinica]|uniref:hypothetical protein n=1 Tax=Nocardia farcinica TaxID=37329 RepID=UPI001895776E|nr:hypothetical protein [Nocardia farcinica]MBF6254387.1 hypothetical protein [Nocardia farcinica]MBF6584445.1 hypothetical protein [Nocardia farcinica]